MTQNQYRIAHHFSCWVFFLSQLVLIGCIGGLSDINIFSDQEEADLGEQFANEIEKDLDINDDADLNSYIQELGQLLVSHSKRHNIAYTFKIVSSEEVNAFAIPGGHVYVNVGLLRISETESELAGVIAHEIGHVVERHGMKQLTKQMGMVMISQLIFGEDPDKIQEIISQITLSGVLMKYSRDAEREADRNAVEITYAAELNPSGIVKFFDKLQRQKDQKDSQISTQIQKLISSHPLTSERISNVKKLISKLPPRPLRQRSLQRFLQLKKQLPPPKESDSRWTGRQD